MDFEPQVLQSIELYSRRARIGKSLSVFVFLAAAAATVTLLVLAFIEGRGIEFLMILAVFITGGLIYTYVVRRSFNLYVVPVRPEDPVSLEEFEEELEAVSLGAGIETPQLVVLDVPTRNSVSFNRHGVPSVGITGDLISEPVTRGLAESMMAHEVAHVILGDVLRPRDLWRIEVLPFTALAMLALLGAGVFLLSGEGIGDWVALVVILYWTFLIWLGVALGFLIRRFDLLRRHDDMLADSIAVKITSDPEALQDAIHAIDEAYDEAEAEPPDSYCSKHLFICPHDYKRWKRRHSSREWRDFIFDSLVFERDMETQLAEEREHIRDRIANLMAIEQGHWPAFGGPGTALDDLSDTPGDQSPV